MGLRMLTAAAAIAVSIGSASAQQITPQQTEWNLKTFDELDFDVWSNQKWDRASESHAENVKVYWPDGRVTICDSSSPSHPMRKSPATQFASAMAPGPP
jgi:hypothetical protein